MEEETKKEKGRVMLSVYPLFVWVGGGWISNHFSSSAFPFCLIELFWYFTRLHPSYLWFCLWTLCTYFATFLLCPYITPRPGVTRQWKENCEIFSVTAEGGSSSVPIDPHFSSLSLLLVQFACYCSAHSSPHIFVHLTQHFAGVDEVTKKIGDLTLEKKKQDDDDQKEVSTFVGFKPKWNPSDYLPYVKPPRLQIAEPSHISLTRIRCMAYLRCSSAVRKDFGYLKEYEYRAQKSDREEGRYYFNSSWYNLNMPQLANGPLFCSLSLSLSLSPCHFCAHPTNAQALLTANMIPTGYLLSKYGFPRGIQQIPSKNSSPKPQNSLFPKHY